jgi:hypothetical protein
MQVSAAGERNKFRTADKDVKLAKIRMSAERLNYKDNIVPLKQIRYETFKATCQAEVRLKTLKNEKYHLLKVRSQLYRFQATGWKLRKKIVFA